MCCRVPDLCHSRVYSLLIDWPVFTLPHLRSGRLSKVGLYPRSTESPHYLSSGVKRYHHLQILSSSCGNVCCCKTTSVNGSKSDGSSKVSRQDRPYYNLLNRYLPLSYVTLQAWLKASSIALQYSLKDTTIPQQTKYVATHKVSWTFISRTMICKDTTTQLNSHTETSYPIYLRIRFLKHTS